MKEIKAYNCDFCKKYSKSKGFMARHEKECFYNPIAKACATCSKLYQQRIVTDEERRISMELPACEAGIPLTHETKAVLRDNCSEWVLNLTELDEREP